MSEASTKSSGQRVKRLGLTGIAIGALSVLACELPIILALVGLGGLGSIASVLSPSPLVEMIGVAFGVIGLFLVVGLLIHRALGKVPQ